MWKEKVGLQLYSVRENLEKDFEGTLRKVKEMGYSAVEFAGLYGNAPEKVKALCEEIGLVPLSAHVPFQELKADPEGTVECYKKAGCRYIVIPYLTEEYRPGAVLYVWQGVQGRLSAPASLPHIQADKVGGQADGFRSDTEYPKVHRAGFR